MASNLTEEEFSRHVNTKFRVKLDPAPFDLELESVKIYAGHEGDQEQLERFSVFFTGAIEVFLPQATYSLEHEAMGEFLIFLVPIGKSETGFRYEGVFNYFRE